MEAKTKSFHVWYECFMLSETCKALKKHLTSREATDFDSVECYLMEAFLVHFRNLAAFFFDDCRPEPHETDIYVEQFKPSLKRQAKKNVKRHYKRAHTEIMHLTTERHLERKEKEWPYLELHDELMERVEKFSKLPDLHEVWAQRPVPTKPPLGASPERITPAFVHPRNHAASGDFSIGGDSGATGPRV